MEFQLFVWDTRKNSFNVSLFLNYLLLFSWPDKYYPKKIVCGYEIEKPDTFHEYIVYDEINRVGSGGF